MIYSFDNERSVLGSMILSERAAEDAVQLLKSEDFAREAHQIVFESIAQLLEQGKPVTDFELLKSAIGSKMEMVGGEDHLLDMAQFVPSPAHVRHYAQIVQDKAQLRRMFEAGKRLQAMALDADISVAEVRAYAATIGEGEQSREVPFFHLREVDSEGEDKGVPSGFPSLDSVLSTHGYPSGNHSIVSAYHKGGKSTFMVSSCAAMARQGKSVLYATFGDLNKRRVKKRIMRYLCGWSKRPMQDLESQADYDSAMFEIETAWKAYVYDASNIEGGSTVEAFVAWLKSQHKRTPFECVFVDYAQLLSSTDRRATNTFADAEICSTKLAHCAAKLDIPIVIGSQITEGGKDGRDRTKNGRKWEEDAGLVLRIRREGETEATIAVAFSRYGGDGTELPFLWNKARVCFEELPQK